MPARDQTFRQKRFDYPPSRFFIRTGGCGYANYLFHALKINCNYKHNLYCSEFFILRDTQKPKTVRDEYLKEASAIIPDPNALINVVSRRSKQLKFGNKPLVESLEKLEPEDIALREIIEGKISYQEWEDDGVDE